MLATGPGWQRYMYQRGQPKQGSQQDKKSNTTYKGNFIGPFIQSALHAGGAALRDKLPDNKGQVDRRRENTTKDNGTDFRSIGRRNDDVKAVR